MYYLGFHGRGKGVTMMWRPFLLPFVALRYSIIYMKTTFSAIQLFKDAWKLLVTHKRFYIKTVLVYGGIMVFANILIGKEVDGLSDIILQIISSVASWYGTFLLMKASLLVSSGKQITGDAFALTPRLVFSLIFASILTGLGTFLGLILLIIPGIIFAIRASFAQYIVIDQGERAVSAIKKSIALTKGYSWSIVRVALCICVLSVISVFPLLFTGFIITVPLSIIALSLAYRKIQNGGGVVVSQETPTEVTSGI